VISARAQTLFTWLVIAQAAHSVEEYVGRLWETFPPAQFLTGLVSSDREAAFLFLNIALIAFGAACIIWPVRRHWPIARGVMWFWVVIETINGVVHPLWSARQGGYTPGVLTSPVLFVLALSLARSLMAESSMRGKPAERVGDY
jgi:hypothetical protein